MHKPSRRTVVVCLVAFFYNLPSCHVFQKVLRYTRSLHTNDPAIHTWKKKQTSKLTHHYQLSKAYQ